MKNGVTVEFKIHITFMEEVLVHSCTYCSNSLPSRGYYCPSCRNQVRCKSCGDVLERDASGCVMCGASVTDSTLNPTSDSFSTNNRHSAPNKIGFKKQGNSVSLEAELTDLASSYLADTLGQIVTNGVAIFRNQNKSATFLTKNPSKTISIPVSVANSEKVSLNSVSNISEGEEDILKRIFSYENDILKLKDPRLKSSGKLDQAVRLILITLYTYEMLGMQQVERSIVMEILRYSKLDDPHAKGWIANAEELVKTDSLLELSVPGREIAKAILIEIGDSSIEVGKVVYSKGKSGKGGKKRRGNQSSKSSQESDLDKSTASKAASGRPSPMTMVEKLISEDFFREKKRLSDIIEHCKVNKAQNYKNTDLSSALSRLIQKDQLKRAKNTSDNQYEYYN